MTEHMLLYTLVNTQGLGKELSYLDQSYLALKQLGVILGGIHRTALDRISYVICPNVPRNIMMELNHSSKSTRWRTITLHCCNL